MLGINLDTHFGHAGQNVGAPGLVGDQDLAGITHQTGVDMLVSFWVLQHGGNMQSPLVGKGRGAHIRRLAGRRPVQKLV